MKTSFLSFWSLYRDVVLSDGGQMPELLPYQRRFLEELANLPAFPRGLPLNENGKPGAED